MRLTENSLRKLRRWLYDSHNETGDRDLIAEFIDRVYDDTWLSGRWYVVRDVLTVPNGSATYVVWLRQGMRVVAICDVDGEPGLVEVTAVIP